MKKQILLFAFAVICCLSIFASAGRAADRVSIIIEVFADSANHLTLHRQVETGTNARDLMDTIFKMDYQDIGRKFVVAIAGLAVRSQERQFWQLEIDGQMSSVGIADVRITKPMRIRWQIASY